MERAQFAIPRLDDFHKAVIDDHHGFDERALVGIESAQSVFGGERYMVFAVVHVMPTKVMPNRGIRGYQSCCDVAMS
jgi:hypothetical protein